MKIIKGIWMAFKNLRLRSKLILSFISLISIPSLVIGFGFYNTSSKIISENTSENIFNIVKKNTQITDIKFSRIEESALMMAVDPDLYRLFEGYNAEDESNLLRLNYEMSVIISKYFSMYEDVYSAYIVTSKFSFGSNSKMFIPQSAFYKTSIYSDAVEAKGKTRWIRTYDFTDMFNQKELKNTNLDYRYMFAAVKLLNISTLESQNYYDGTYSSPVIKSLNSNIERPILILNFQENIFHELYSSSLPIKEAVYYIIDRQGNIISHPDKAKLNTKETPVWLQEAIQKGAGSSYVNINGHRTLVCYDTSKVTGWISAFEVPVDKTLSSLTVVRYYTLYLAIGITILAIIIAFLISGRIVQPIKKLLKAIRSIGEGNFPNRIMAVGNDEMGILVDNFNIMNEKIQKLIEENYEVKIREKEAHIMALNLQLNPHFMSNTLNTINWMAIENNQSEISKMIMSLSTMLQYTMRNTTEMVKFKDDLDWLKSYVFIMKNRYEDVFGVEYQFDEKLYDTMVPKLFLQPIVENAIIHGFETVETGGYLKITGSIENGIRNFVVEDNGKGMTPEKNLKVMKSDENSIGIKNIDKRVKLLFGEEYGLHIESQEGKGTKVCIMIPYDG
ncbi:sensor histidine kinase [Ruminiclostridium cellobioparum]|uniref:Histidine kinase,HAMP domain-containing protein n=1 Tax=Ruminiclostridium cellobioparum subsp. termitidis CT1112 TaxID=1195236 RepID=S0FRM4_RUMCE|nr:sensor histidine kinase [Ruminiclostridium cellobioparum]EMS73001.1 histidine kinase,HAMP domain-containing protein [Ruminiclostridium cellobioparum subsp. termitidis CT1112]